MMAQGLARQSNGGQIVFTRLLPSPREAAVQEEVEGEQDEEIMRPLDRFPSARNWEEVIPRLLRRKFETGKKRH